MPGGAETTRAEPVRAGTGAARPSTGNNGATNDDTSPAAAPGARREQLLAAAARLMADRGYHGVSINDIGAATGVSGPAVYKHFASKQAILTELLVGISERLLAEGTARVAAAVTPDEALDALVRWHVSFALGSPELIRIQDRDLASMDEAAARAVRRLQRRYVEVWVAQLRARDPNLGEDAARAAVHATFGLLNSTPYSASGAARLGRARMADLLRRLGLAALRAAS
ncbi:TetR family transcriptional regulator [Frankia sp. CNm7]|uniref:TetR family transcriptional regulator n=1 Tax=Frankia nepalensis TaxID=1836974 RepID=A0A937UJM1_9ACTN|nr:TetR/AcrR family transcriptional regulator [Frankia nepalensis]MBL7501846.1 TetR family transcriptional regulator [Frankia nepalensis]MBL7515020.1 TetR family transcriptional regulator [Frankia nepalensis]MBL7518730.1 TetR family transcriptional regulator [Frankia nepalensis]MBL7625934.1 TetR family transcriptional regulator [Frankia nepalensis]